MADSSPDTRVQFVNSSARQAATFDRGAARAAEA
jgi:hypothetical protein